MESKLVFSDAASSEDITANSLYQKVDLHMTDSTAHNKGIGTNLANKTNRDDEAGQAFCDSHSSLGLASDISQCVNKLENEMGMSNIFSGFLVDVDIDQKYETVSLNAVHWSLNLLGPDMLQKAWNYYREFSVYMKRLGKPIFIIHMKDARFGYLPRCCAILCHHWDDFKAFLETCDTTNKLACLVRDSLELDYCISKSL